MRSAWRSAVAPIYLFGCLLLGGSAQGLWQNALLQLIGLAILVWAAAWPPPERLPRSARPILWLVFAAIAIVAIQAIPLPPSFSMHGVRAEFATGYDILGLPFPALPISVAPYNSLSSLLGLIPPLAIFCAMVRFRAYRSVWLAVAVLVATIAGIILGALQVAAKDLASPLYIYRDTNFGSAVGFFANANHMASLMVTSLPLAAAVAASTPRGDPKRPAVIVVLVGYVVLALVGVVLNGSIAGFALIVPVMLMSAIIAFDLSQGVRKAIAALAALGIAASVAAMAITSIGTAKLGADTRLAVTSRAEILATTGHAIADYMPFGSGLGTFRKVYQTYENPTTVTNEYAVHAHNDYAEIALEMGVAGALLTLCFLAWWALAVWRVWFSKEGGPFAQAASVASAALLTHSLVEFPLRTAALSACFAMYLAFLADRRRPRQQHADDLRPTRHVVID